MKLAKSLLIASSITGMISTASFANADLVAQGEKIFMTKSLGNCVACHSANGKDNVNNMGPGSFGPALSGLAYWPDQLLYDTVYDIYAARGIEYSAMPPFGRTGWLGDQEIKAVVAYLKTIN